MEEQIYTIVSNEETLEEYLKEYFKKYPRRTKRPIDRPTIPSINTWFILERPQMNDLKQRWKDYTIWLSEKQGLAGLKIESCKITIKMFMPTKRRADTDNYTPKFVFDGLTECGVIIDDSYFYVNPLVIELGYDKNNEHMEIVIEENVK